MADANTTPNPTRRAILAGAVSLPLAVTPALPLSVNAAAPDPAVSAWMRWRAAYLDWFEIQRLYDAGKLRYDDAPDEFFRASEALLAAVPTSPAGVLARVDFLTSELLDYSEDEEDWSPKVALETLAALRAALGTDLEPFTPVAYRHLHSRPSGSRLVA